MPPINAYLTICKIELAKLFSFKYFMEYFLKLFDLDLVNKNYFKIQQLHFCSSEDLINYFFILYFFKRSLAAVSYLLQYILGFSTFILAKKVSCQQKKYAPKICWVNHVYVL